MIIGVGVVLGATLMLCNKAAITIETLETATETASRIFHRAAIDLNWTELPAETCALPTMGPAFTVIIATQSPPDWTSPDAMGFAPAGTGGRPRIYIFMNLVREFIASFHLPAGEDQVLGIVLGHAIAHELGHVLIPGEAHSLLGIMSARWTYEHWRAAIGGTLLFIPKQEAMMRDRLRTW